MNPTEFAGTCLIDEHEFTKPAYVKSTHEKEPDAPKLTRKIEFGWGELVDELAEIDKENQDPECGMGAYQPRGKREKTVSPKKPRYRSTMEDKNSPYLVWKSPEVHEKEKLEEEFNQILSSNASNLKDRMKELKITFLKIKLENLEREHKALQEYNRELSKALLATLNTH